MFSTAHKRILANIFFVLASAAAYGQPPHRTLQEPLLGLRYDTAQVKFEPLPNQLASSCQALDDSGDSHAVWFIFARASDASGRTYYLLNGYEMDRHPTRDYPRYTIEGFGIILGVDRGKCEVLDADARQVFKDRIFDDEFPFEMMQQLAIDFAARLSKAYGSQARLRMAIAKQRIDLTRQPEEIRYALKDLLPAK